MIKILAIVACLLPLVLSNPYLCTTDVNCNSGRHDGYGGINNNIKILINSKDGESKERTDKIRPNPQPYQPVSIPDTYKCPVEKPGRVCQSWVKMRSSAPSPCQTDEQCCKPGGVIMKCCMDSCLGHRTCKPPLILAKKH